MIYNSFNFLVFFPLLFLFYYAIPAKIQQVRNGYLLVVSYLLYANWMPVYALILFGVTCVTYGFARLFDKPKVKRRNLLLGGGNSFSPTTTFLQVFQFHQ